MRNYDTHDAHDEDETPPIEVSADRVVIGMIYLVLSGMVFIGFVHLLVRG